MTYTVSYIKNSKNNIFIILGVVLSSILLISISILFSSFREYLIKTVEKEIGSYHVILKTDIKDNNFILKKQYKNNRYFITYKDIKKVYKNTEKICQNSKCTSITYNDSLLSLYGLSKNKNILSTIKKILYFILIIFSIIIFFIIYNSFKANINTRKKDITLFKLNGFTDYDLYRLYFKESLLLSIIGIVTGFILSIFINIIIIKVLNNLLYEIFKGNLSLNIYFPFLIISLIFIFLIIICSSLIELKDIKKYKPLELFRKTHETENIIVKPLKNISVWLSYINYKREKKKYRSLIICVFTFVFSITIFSIILNYGLTCIKKYVIIPEYDLSISVVGDYNLIKISNDLKSTKKLIYKSCNIKIKIPKKYFLNDYREEIDLLITDIGGNEILNKVDKITNENIIKHVTYQRFKNITELKIEENTISNLKLTSKNTYGFKNLNITTVNLNRDEFNKVCDEYTSNLIINTKYNGIDNYLNKLIKKEELNITYINIKKTKQIIQNVILVLKLLMYLIFFLIVLVMLSVTINITTSNINNRKKEFARLQSIGLESKTIHQSLFLESLIINLKGCFYAIPFIFITNKYIYSGIQKVFYFKKICLGLNNLTLNFIISFVIIFISTITSYRFTKNESLISKIKSNI